MSQGEMLAIVRCPLCKAFLRLPDAKVGWLDCPTCRETVWVSYREPISRRDRLRRLLNNFPQSFLLIWLLLASLGITAVYQVFPDTSPIAWVLFSLAGLAAVIIVSRRSTRLRTSRSEVIAGLKIIFVIWLLSGLMFFVADKGLSLYPLHVDQLAIRVLILIHPLAVFVDKLPAPWIPALVAMLFFLVLALARLPLVDPNGSSSRLLRLVYAFVRFVKGTGVGRQVISAVSAYAKWASVLNAASLGILSFGLSVAVGGWSIELRHADVVDAFLTQPLKADANWKKLEGAIEVSSIAAVLEADWQPSRSCSDGSGGGDCDQLRGFPLEWARTVAFHQPPYPPPSAPPGDSPPRRSPSDPDLPPDLGSPGQASHAQQVPEVTPVHPRPTVSLASIGTSRGRLYDQVTASAGNAWDAAGRAVVPDPRYAPRFDRIPRDLTPAQISAARESFEESAPGGPVFSWTSELVAALFKSAELGGAETIKKLVEEAVNSQFPVGVGEHGVGNVVAKFVDLFLTGPIIEEVREKTEEYVRTRKFEPLISVAAPVRQASRHSLGDLRRLWNFRMGTDEADDRNTTAVFLRQEMVSLFDRTFAFGSAVPASYLGEVRDSLVDKTIPLDGSFDPDTVDRAMEEISKAASLVTTERFESLIALDKKFGVDTSRLTDLRDSQRAKTVQDALNSASPYRKFSASELKAGWETEAMSIWLEGRADRREDIIKALGSFLPSSIECDYYCRYDPGHQYHSGPYCLRPGDPSPCPDPKGVLRFEKQTDR